jgi:anti-sigma factor RsiW
MFSPCRKYREELCVAINGELPAGDRAALERHLEACPDCQKYRGEIGKLTALLTAGGELFQDIVPRETTQMRWAKEFERAVHPAHSTSTGACRAILDWSWDLMWPYRRIWAVMAAIWIVILGLNAAQRTEREAQASSRPSPEIMRALLACEGFLPGYVNTGEASTTKPPKSPSPQHRSELNHENKTS